MAVYTHLSDHDIAESLAKHFSVGELIEATAIAEGIENSNYLVKCEKGGLVTPYIFTLFEKRMDENDLPFFMQLMKQLSAKFSVPVPERTADGGLFLKREQNAFNKPMSLVSFLSGKQAHTITEEKLYALGQYVAAMQQESDALELNRKNSVGKKAWQEMWQPLRGNIQSFKEAETLVEDAFSAIEKDWPDDKQLPRGIIHADLFPDNVFFDQDGYGDEVSGIIDWYFACDDFYAYDIAVIVCAWCFDEAHAFQQARLESFLKGYQSRRSLSEEEKDALPILCIGAALRFLLTRLHDAVNHDEEALVMAKDPMEYYHKLRYFLAAIR